MRANNVVAIIPEDHQNDLVAALHSRSAGHVARVIRRDRGDVLAQLARAGVDTLNVPEAIVTADRILMVAAAHRSPEIGWLLLRRGATSVWIVSPENGWTVMDDTAIDIAATASLPPRPVPPAHRSARTFRPSKQRRRSRHVPAEPSSRSNRTSRS